MPTCCMFLPTLTLSASPGDVFIVCENNEEARRLIEEKLDGRSTLNLQLTTKGELYGHLAQHERNVSRVVVFGLAHSERI